MTGYDTDSDVVLSGLSGRLPESNSIEEFAQQLFAGADLVSEDNRRWTPGLYGLPKRSGKLKDLTRFDAAFFGMLPKQAAAADPQLRLLLEVTYETIVDAGLSPDELRRSRTGVYVGVSNSELCNADLDLNNINGYKATGGTQCMFANRISYTFDLNGPSIAINTACSSSMSALAQAMNDIRDGRCEAAVVAGVQINLTPDSSLSLLSLNILSADGRCAAFDASARGYVPSEAVLAVLLQRRRDARRVYCTVRGARTNSDGYKPQGITYPAGNIQCRLVRETFGEARLRPQDVVYVEAHGTGTQAGDMEEGNAITEAFCTDRQTPLLVGSVKSNMGHAEPASGLCGVAKVVLSMERGVIPGNLHFKNPNGDIPSLSDGRIKVVDTNTAWQGGLVGVNSFGFGGANAHVILEGGRGERPPLVEYPAPRLVLASGRTDEAVERMLQLAADHQRDAELHALLDAVFARAIPGHPHRGYAVLDPARGSAPVMEVLKTEDEPRPVWFVFSGMGSQWAGMARALLRLPAFAASIARSAVVLEPYGVDLHYVIAEAPSAAFDNIVNSFVSIAAVQVALVDVLREVNVRPDGIIGHSVGEIDDELDAGCAYADGALTAEQAVLCAYWRGRCVLDARLAPGAMAAVEFSWEEAARRCPADIQLACHNAPDKVTITGPLASVNKFTQQLSADGVDVKMVDTAGVAFHSKYIAAAAPLLRARLLQVIPEPKPRSARWLSSSVPQDQWDSELARLCDAEYIVNNFLSPVRFADVLARVPARALVVEVGPHALLQAVLKRALPGAVHVPLVWRYASDALVHLLAAVGKIYAAGAQPQVSRLYPAVKWPVSRGTPSLASHVGWDHSIEWILPEFKAEFRTGENIIEYNLNNSDDSFFAGHNIDGRVLFPAAGYLTLVWRSLAKLNRLKMEEAPVVFENVHFCHTTFFLNDAPLRFHVTLFNSSGEFEVCAGGAAVATGTVRLTTDPNTERLSSAAFGKNEEKQDDLLLLDSDVYKELHLRGYNYDGVFCGIKSMNALGTHGLISWVDNWISFMDTMLQFISLGKCCKRGLYLPTHLQRAVIDPTTQRAAVVAAASSGSGVPIRACSSINIAVAGGVEFHGVKFSLAPRHNDAQSSPKLEKYVFVPLDGARLNTGHVLAAMLHLAMENHTETNLKLVEYALRRPLTSLLLPRAIRVLNAEGPVHVDATLLAGDYWQQYEEAMSPLGVKVSNKDGGLGDCYMVLGGDVVGHGDDLLALAATCGAAGFMLLEEPARALFDPAAQALLAAASLELVSRASAGEREYVLLRRAATMPAARVVVEARENDYDWMEQLKEAIKRAETENMRVYVWSRAPDSGVLGLGKCMRCEPGGDRLRFYYLPGVQDAFDPEAPPYRAQVEKDLTFNVLRDGVWGTFRHLLLENYASAQVEHAYVDTLTRGDLSSLRWIESDLRLRRDAAAARRPRTDLCHVYYSALNFRDLMLATGKLPPDALPENITEQEGVLGLEFSGHSSTGKRIMGIVTAKGLATTLLADESLTFEVPKQWSLEEAATVPVAYATAYYALTVRGGLKRGESVLVHAGASDLGQAAIAVALSAGCTVFTTVSTLDERSFLRTHFPQLPDANIGNSRDCTFQTLVLRRTHGRGVDLVLNSLAGDKLKASLNCLAKGGRFLDISKLDMSYNSALGMAVLLKNITVHGIQLETLFEEPDSHPEKAEVLRCMAEGIASGAVRPLPATVYADHQLEEAFRFMATDNCIGKVLIRVCEEADGEPAPPRLLSAMRRTYMHPGKSYVLVGGLGGIGLELGEWLVRRGARTLVLTSRTGSRTGYQAWCIRRWRAEGVHVLVSTTDATTEAGARALLREAAAAAPVGGIFNLAAVIISALFENQTPDNFRVVMKPKINATRALDAASRELAPDLEHFVVFSSVSSGRGGQGLTHYGLANSGMERICEQRRAAGLPALAVQWGPVGDVGLLADVLRPDDVTSGNALQPIHSCLEMLDTFMVLPHAVTASTLIADKRRAQKEPTRDLRQTVADILGLKDLDKVSETVTLAALGMDSLMGTDIMRTLERDFDVFLTAGPIRALTFRAMRDLAPLPHRPSL